MYISIDMYHQPNLVRNIIVCAGLCMYIYIYIYMAV
jgi:hypothetical protein